MNEMGICSPGKQQRLHAARARAGLLPLFFAWLAATGCATPAPSGAESVRQVASINALRDALTAAMPGTTILVAAGNYDLRDRLVLSASGTAARPVTVRAAAGGVTLGGRGGLDIENAEWLVLDGFTLAWQARTMNLRNVSNLRLTGNTWRYAARPGDPRESTVTTHWLRIHDGGGHRVDNNELGPHPGGLGVTLLVENAVTDLRIDHNYFHDRPRDGRNGAETLRIGAGGGSRIAATIDNNLFERCDGETELISIKSDGARIVGNTFRDNRGQLVVRNGMHILVARNHFIARERDITGGGIRVHGKDICIAQNRFQGIPGPVLQTFPGQFERDDGPARKKGYPRSENVVFAANLVVGPQAAGKAGIASRPIDTGTRPTGKAGLLAHRWQIVNNYFLLDGVLLAGDAHAEFDWRGNVVGEPGAKNRSANSSALPTLQYDAGQWHVRNEQIATSDRALPGCDSPRELMPMSLPAPLVRDFRTSR